VSETREKLAGAMHPAMGSSREKMADAILDAIREENANTWNEVQETCNTFVFPRLAALQQRVAALEDAVKQLQHNMLDVNIERLQDHGGTEAADLSGSSREHTPPADSASVKSAPAPAAWPVDGISAAAIDALYAEDTRIRGYRMALAIDAPAIRAQAVREFVAYVAQYPQPISGIVTLAHVAERWLAEQK